MIWDPTKQLSKKAEQSIEDFWNFGTDTPPDPFNPENLPKLEVETLFPHWVKDSRGIRWDLSMTYTQHDLNAIESKYLWVRFTSAEKHPITLEQAIPYSHFQKLTDRGYIQTRLDELWNMIEENLANRKAQPGMVVDKPLQGGKP